MQLWYEILLGSNNIDAKCWQELFCVLKRYLGWRAEWHIHLCLEQGTIHYYINLPKALPSGLGLKEFFSGIFGQKNHLTLDQLRDKFAFDIKLPTKVNDSTTGEVTYSAMPNAESYIKNGNIAQYERDKGWILKKKDTKSIDQIIQIWKTINYTTTERVYDSENVVMSDPIYNSTNVYASTNCGNCKNILFCDGTYDSEFAIACQRSTGINFCLRVDDSNSCTNSYNIICCSKISNSFFIQDASNLNECMFCSHISDREYCIANMQYEREEYLFIKQQVIKWILGSNAKIKS